MTRAAVIEVEGLRKVYGSVVAVDGVAFEVYEGEIFGMVGPNGAGKTTTIECLCDRVAIISLGIDLYQPLAGK